MVLDYVISSASQGAGGEQESGPLKGTKPPETDPLPP